MMILSASVIVASLILTGAIFMVGGETNTKLDGLSTLCNSITANLDAGNDVQEVQPVQNTAPANNTPTANTNTGTATAKNTGDVPNDVAGVTTFKDNGMEACTENGKPVIYLFSTTWCPHCTWVKDTFDSTVKSYVDDGKIVAYHWELDTGDNTLTEAVETEVPSEQESLYREFNPRGSIPTFVMGCKYWRIGNGHERTEDLEAEEAEFKAVIDELIKQAQ